MNMREKFNAAKAAVPSMHRRDIEASKLLLSFTKGIPAMVEGALLRMQAGENVNPRDAMFIWSVNLPVPPWRGSQDARIGLESLTNLPALQKLKAYLSDPAVDMAFMLELKQSPGLADDVLQLMLIPGAPFDKSYLASYGSTLGYETRHMTDEDKSAWTSQIPKPKLSAPSRL